jgi:1-deoxy-D-xylulose-5-phosphate reductoisomerase
MRKRVAIVGATGSIGRSTLQVIYHLKNLFSVYALASKYNYRLLTQEIISFRPQLVVTHDAETKDKLIALLKKFSVKIPKILYGPEGLLELATSPQVDHLVIATSGTEFISPLLSAIKERKRISLATKELMVSFGKIIMEAVKKYNTVLLPIDSELVGIHQCFHGHHHGEIKRVIITASGGPFFGRKNFKNITVKETLKHPVWKMGKKTTVDSATLANKGLEIIETARYFDLSDDKIDVVIHPQSIIHSMLEFKDSSIIAQLAKPDMRLCIQYALTYPQRLPSLVGTLDLTTIKQLEFSKPNLKRFEALNLAYQALRTDGIAPCVYNVANEVAVKYFLKGQLDFLEIPKIIRTTLNAMPVIKNPNLEELLKWESKAREFAKGLICYHQ